MAKVNVVLPFYNVAEYIEESVRSICEQTFQDIAIYLIDSGSTDGSAAVAERTLANYTVPYRIVQQQTSDVSAARNAGIDLATDCEYIYFMDSDDRAHPNLIATLVSLVEAHNLDLAGCMFQRVDQYGKPLNAFVETVVPLNTVISPDTTPEILLLQVAVWNKLFKRQIIDQHQLRFTEEHIYEDIHFTKKYLMYCNRLYFTDAVLYDYRQRPKSLMQDGSARNKDIVAIFDKLLQEVGQEGLQRFEPVVLQSAFINIIINTPVRLCQLQKADYFREFYEMPLVARLLSQGHHYAKGLPWKHRLIYFLVKRRWLGILAKLV